MKRWNSANSLSVIVIVIVELSNQGRRSGRR
jgi:hypothetical protein